MQIILEIYFCKINSCGLIYLKREVNIAGNNSDPDDSVLDLLTEEFCVNQEFIKKYCIIHSTSRRYQKPATIILTYIVYSDYFEFKDKDCKLLRLSDLKLASTNSNHKPGPQSICKQNVLSYAIRHLSYPVQIDSQRTYSKILSPENLKIFEKIHTSVSGKITLQEGA
jgi:hypothetical protein